METENFNMNPNLQQYDNTSENAVKVGWNLFPEYCIGYEKAKFVTHDSRRGIFKFHN